MKEPDRGSTKEQGTFLQNYLELPQILKIEEDFYAIFTDQNNLNSLGRGSPKEHLCQIIFKSGHYFLTRRFFKFSLYKYIYGKQALLPGGHVFKHIRLFEHIW